MINIQKAAIIGCGFVGAATAFRLMQTGLFSELVLIDADRKKAEGEAMDLSHGRPFAHTMKIYAGELCGCGRLCGDYRDSRNQSEAGGTENCLSGQKCGDPAVGSAGNCRAGVLAVSCWWYRIRWIF